MASKSDLPQFRDYFAPALRVLRERGGSATIEELEDGVAELMELSDSLLAVRHGDGPRTQFQYELAWVRTYLKKVSAVTNSERGVWSLTDKGEKMTDSDALEVAAKVRALENERRKGRSAEAALEAEDDSDEGSWIDRLLAILGTIDSSAFERLTQRLLRESGFTKVEVTGRSGDGGIDGIGILRMNLVSFQVLFQCKRWKGSVGPSEVRDFRGAMVGRADKGLIVTTGTFSSDARKEATRDGAPAIDLVDGETLCLLLKERKLGIAIQTVERIELDESFFRAI
jgi:restriction system protein